MMEKVNIRTYIYINTHNDNYNSGKDLVMSGYLY